MPGDSDHGVFHSGGGEGVEGMPGVQVILRQITKPYTCEYLHDRPARLDVRMVAGVGPGDYGALLEQGFRRFGMMVFRPACEGCAECVPIRIPVDRFRPSASQRRVIRKNADVRVQVGEPRMDAERLELHRAFHRERSAHVGWKPQEITEEEYSRTFLDNIVATLEISYRIAGRLAAVAYVDVAPESINSIYCFHGPEFHRRSLGTYDVLTQIAITRRLGRPYLYLGYLIAACRSMAYKASFQPAEVLREGAWRELGG